MSKSEGGTYGVDDPLLGAILGVAMRHKLVDCTGRLKAENHDPGGESPPADMQRYKRTAVPTRAKLGPLEGGLQPGLSCTHPAGVRGVSRAFAGYSLPKIPAFTATLTANSRHKTTRLLIRSAMLGIWLDSRLRLLSSIGLCMA